MIKGKYILVNGSFIASDEFRITHEESENKLFTISIRSTRTTFPFFGEFIGRLKQTLEIYNKQFEIFTGNNGDELKHQLLRTLTKNKFFLGAVLSLTFQITNDLLTYSLVAHKIDEPDFRLNEKGMFAHLCTTISKPVSFYSWLLAESELYWKIALAQNDNSPDTVLFICNTENRIIEAVGSNIYLVKGNTVLGLDENNGAFIDISKKKLLNIFSVLKLKFIPCRGFSILELSEADELFIANSIDGIRWVVGFEDKRYFNNIVKKISSQFGN